MTANENTYILQKSTEYTNDGGTIDSHEHAFDDLNRLADNQRNLDGDDDTNMMHKSSLPWASFNFINSIVGSGVIGIPYALHRAGFGLGLILLLSVAYITDYSLILMVRCGHISGRFSYQGIMEAAYGRTGYILLGVLQFVYPFIAMVSYNVVVGDTVTKVIIRLFDMEEDSIMASRKIVVLLATLLITVPLCLYRNIAKLAKISFLSLVCIVFILFAIMIRFETLSDSVPKQENSWQFANNDIIPAIGVMAFAFMCHHNTFLIYGSLMDATEKRWETVTHLSLGVSCIIACLFGIMGYATFTSLSQGDLLENYCPDDDLMNFGRLLFSIQILLTFPIECFVTREVIEQNFCRQNIDGTTEDNCNTTNSNTDYYHYGVTLAIIGATYLVSISTNCLGFVLELNGVLAAVPLAYVLPALSYLKLEDGNLCGKRKFPALTVAVIGVIVAVLGVIMLVNDYDTIGQCVHGGKMPYCTHNYNATYRHGNVTNKML